MNHERLAALIREQQAILDAGSQHRTTRHAILSILRAVDQEELTPGQAVHLLIYQAQRMDDEPDQAALYRQAAADIRQMQREER
jgi:hypothetical protein